MRRSGISRDHMFIETKVWISDYDYDAWSPIGGITSYRGGEKRTFDDPTLREIALQHGKSAAQVMLRRA